MEVPLDPPSLGVGGINEALPRAAQVVHAGAQRARSPLFGRLAGKANLRHPSCSLCRAARFGFDNPRKSRLNEAPKEPGDAQLAAPRTLANRRGFDGVQLRVLRVLRVADIRADISPKDLLYAVASLCLHVADGGVAYSQRMVALLVDGLRYGADTNQPRA
jgi:hypothetical protein